MKQISQRGSALSIVLIAILSLGLLSSLVFGGWAFGQRQEYKNDSDKKSQAAVASAERALREKIDNEYAEKAKSPFKTYQGSSNVGGLTFNYPKTWSAYVIDTTNTGQALNGYFHPEIIPGISQDTLLALRVEVTNTAYEQEVARFDNQTKQGKMTATAYMPKKLKDKPNAQAGVLFQGEIDQKKKGAVFVIKLRDKTLKLTTDSVEYQNDFINTVLESLNFTP